MNTLDLKGSVVDDEVAFLYKELDMNYISPQLVSDFLKDSGKKPVTLYLNSPGGNVFAADDIYSQLLEYQGKVTVVIQGIAASAGSIIAMGSDKLLMTAPSMLMLHRCIADTEGNANDLMKAAKVQLQIDNSIAQTYSQKTGMTVDECIALMDDETWLTAPEAVKQKLADGIYKLPKKDMVVNDSLVSLPSKDKARKVINMLHKDKPVRTKHVNNLLQQKIDILKGVSK